MVNKNRGTLSFPVVFILLAAFLFSGFGCTQNKESDGAEGEKQKNKKEVEASVPSLPVTFKTISGTWELKYANNYGYTFRFYKNYRSIVILYLNNHALIFKGIYTFEGSNQVRINIYEMKKSHRLSGINLSSGFVKAKSSFFKFSVELRERKKKKLLIVSPRNITIDGNNSDGYFEPVIKLKRRGR